VRLVAMADVFADRLQGSLANLTHDDTLESEGLDASFRSKIDVPEERQFVGWEGYLQLLDLVDVVILTTPPAFRPLHFEAAVRAGKHVFMEKPVAVDAPGIRRVLAAAEEAKAKRLNVVVGLQRHYQQIYREWIERLHDGAIGDLILSRVYWNSAGVWVHPRADLEAAAGRSLSELEYQMRNWYYFNWICGDHIVEQHIHNIDVSNWAKNALPIRAQGQGGREVRVGPDFGEIYDHHIVEYEYADGSRMLSQCRHMPGCMNRVSEAFHGTRGSAPRPGEILAPDGSTIWSRDARNDANPYQVEHDELFAAIAQGEYRFADAQRGADATMTAILGRMATYSGKVITWDEAMASELTLGPADPRWETPAPIAPGEDGMYAAPIPGVSVVL
jgi:predicted dehydrogenase